MKCKEGFTEKNGTCIKTSCNLDGKQFCKPGDMSLRPAIPRPGGKSQIADVIISKAPVHKTYVEPFFGGGAVFLKKPLAEKNVINDKDINVTTVYKSFKDGEGLSNCDMRFSEEKAKELMKKTNKNACDVARLTKWSFGGKGMDVSRARHDPKFKDDPSIGIKYQQLHNQDYHNKLKNAIIMNDDFSKVMQNHDSPLTFHYLDPPYDGTQYVYNQGKSLQPEQVCSVAKSMKGKVMISYNDSPRVRKACAGMNFKKVQTRYSLSSDKSDSNANEVLITNY